MHTSSLITCNPRLDRYSVPRAGALIEAMDPSDARAVRAIRTRVKSITGLRESVGWQGRIWGWTLVYSIVDASNRTQPVLYVVPVSPHPELCIPAPWCMCVDPTCNEIVNQAVSPLNTTSDGAEVSGAAGFRQWCRWTLETDGLADPTVPSAANRALSRAESQVVALVEKIAGWDCSYGHPVTRS